MLKDDKTVIASITQVEVEAAETAYNEYREALETLERMNWNYENYGTFTTPKPNWSKRSNNNE